MIENFASQPTAGLSNSVLDQRLTGHNIIANRFRDGLWAFAHRNGHQPVLEPLA